MACPGLVQEGVVESGYITLHRDRLWNSNMGSNVHGGISRSGSPGSYTYSVRTADSGFNNGQSMGNMPVNFVSFWDAARFTNWLTTGDTETRVYVLTEQGIADNTITRDATAWANGGVAIARRKSARSFTPPTQSNRSTARFEKSAATAIFFPLLIRPLSSST